MLEVDRAPTIVRLPAAGRGWHRFTGPLRGEGTQARRAWRVGYVRQIAVGDLLSAVVAAVIGYGVRFAHEDITAVRVSLWFALGLPLVWLSAMSLARAYEQRFLWVGAEEFRRVFFAAVMLLAFIGTASWASRIEVARSFVVLAVPLATLLTMGQRGVHRWLLHRSRRHGRKLQTTVLVGHRSAVERLDEQLLRESYHGYKVVGCCLPEAPENFVVDAFNGLPLLGTIDRVADVVKRYEVDAVAVLPCPELDGPELRKLGWELEDTAAELLLAPAVTEIVGPRVHIRPVSGLPLVHMEPAEFRGTRRVVKGLFDRTAAAVLILLMAPVLLGLALAVKLTSRGPVFFKHERVGRRGEPFSVLKFRSMVDGADKRFDSLQDKNEGNAVQFKMKQDPRVTRVGAVMRRYSLDELPQLFNVVGGSMSLVGPRPHITREVEQYGMAMRRRLLVKPGITGLWQVSGRSNLTWDESVRIDVRYVENWSLTFDLMILCRTVGAVIRGSGAY